MAFLFRQPAPATTQPPRPSRRLLRGRDRTRGQTMVEVALVLPIFIFTLMTVLELGYFVAVGSAVSSASREAARWGATVGTFETPPVPNYIACDEIRAHARETSGALITLTDEQIVITYDNGQDPVSAVAVECEDSLNRPDPAELARFDRVVIEVTYVYEPVTPFLRPLIGSQEMTSTDRRSIGKP